MLRSLAKYLPKHRPVDYFNRHLAPDMVSVLDASSALEVTEFRFFQLAFQDWYGKKAEEPTIEKCFAAYMFANRIPGWVRHFARKILNLQSSGQLDPKRFGVRQRLPSARMMFFAKVYTAVLLLIFLFATVSVYSLPDKAMAVFQQCYFPPCY